MKRLGIKVVCNHVLLKEKKMQRLYAAVDKLRRMRSLTASATKLGEQGEGERPWIVNFEDSVMYLRCLAKDGCRSCDSR